MRGRAAPRARSVIKPHALSALRTRAVEQQNSRCATRIISIINAAASRVYRMATKRRRALLALLFRRIAEQQNILKIGG